MVFSAQKALFVFQVALPGRPLAVPIAVCSCSHLFLSVGFTYSASLPHAFMFSSTLRLKTSAKERRGPRSTPFVAAQNWVVLQLCISRRSWLALLYYGGSRVARGGRRLYESPRDGGPRPAARALALRLRTFALWHPITSLLQRDHNLARQYTIRSV